ncbi:MAG: AAA family ATPase [Elusimicrobia bacterium]|nr:AAA family ATPase [Candidatus Obscuribacterium magneticum]
MITKVKRLKNIGKFYNFAAKENVLDWHKNTFVFAPNAYGKTTLVNVLLSLRDNDPKLMRARKTLGAATEPEALIVIDSANYLFDGIRWERQYPAIQIFDVPFIQANILAHEIGHEHKKNIHKIIIGAEGVKLADELSNLKAKEKAKSQEVVNLANEFNRGGFINLSLGAFLVLYPDEEVAVGPRIQQLEQDIKSKQSEGIVQGLGFPRTIAAPAFDSSGVKEIVALKLTAAHEAAEKRVLEHINWNFKDKTHAKEFIRLGIDQTQANCPFCGQDLKNATGLLKAYQEFFDDAFRTYQQSVAQQLAALSGWNIDNDLTTLVSAHNSNLSTLSQWAPYLGTIVLPDVVATVDSCRSRLAALKGKVQSELEKKQKDPNADADLSQLDALTAELAGLKTAVGGYNAAGSSFVEKAKQYIANLPKSDVAALQIALVKEKEIKRRFEPEWKRWAINYSAAKKEADNLINQKNAKQKELEIYSKTIFDTDQKRINELLSTLGTDFTITGLTGKADERANESYSDFGFLILEQIVPLSARQDDEPCFKNTLSEGDKSTLAFAFFIAALEKIPELDKQIVLFDDPLSSLDETRREATARLLLALSPAVKQLNVFTHKQDFLYMLCDKMPENKVLQIRSDKKNGSRLEMLNVEEARKSEHVRLVEDMERYVGEDFGPTADTMQGNLRKIFEVVLKTKYYRALAVDIKSKHGFATLLTTLFNAGLLNAAMKPRLFDLCSVADSAHHGEIIDTTPKKLSRDELIPLIREALNLVYKV